MEEVNEESEHKGWCDTAFDQRADPKRRKQAVETLYAEIDELVASTAHWTEHIKELNKAVAELDVAVATATSIREERKAKKTVTVKDSQDDQLLLPKRSAP